MKMRGEVGMFVATEQKVEVRDEPGDWARTWVDVMHSRARWRELPFVARAALALGPDIPVASATLIYQAQGSMSTGIQWSANRPPHSYQSSH